MFFLLTLHLNLFFTAGDAAGGAASNGSSEKSFDGLFHGTWLAMTGSAVLKKTWPCDGGQAL
ncbi:MAG: hypothetical protein EOO28_05135 [Comamonadaceae bacterium]|nr:MAG: hypothetical protein EOO28_05135 [Comamonadaceae bacterium]